MTTIGENLYNKIDTFVFFDLETTDLIKRSKMPKVTELSMVATSRKSLKADKRNRLALPRIMHKLVIPICPMQPINPQASYCSNLWNDALDNVKPFDETTYDMIIQFLERLPGVICFVAHNGNRFDYPVFLSELDQIKKTFPDSILCVDTLIAFKEFFSDTQPVAPPIQDIPPGIDEVDEEELARLESKDFDTSLDDNWNDSLCSALDDIEKTNRKGDRISRRFDLICENGRDVLDAKTNKNEQTDCSASGTITPETSLSDLSTMQAINEKTPESQIIRNSPIHRVGSSSDTLANARKQLNFDISKPKNFKLATIYINMIGCEAENLHCAEGDCISMLRCVSQMGPHFAEWADCTAVSLNHFKKERAEVSPERRKH